MPSEKHIIVKGKKYKKSPLKDSPRKRKLVKGLMKARRDVKTALDKKNAKSERNARNRVQKFKVLLGERSGKKKRQTAAKNYKVFQANEGRRRHDKSRCC